MDYRFSQDIVDVELLEYLGKVFVFTDLEKVTLSSLSRPLFMAAWQAQH